jgi:1-acyl-sn-glycerol-3-phosphate acyltransferase
MSRFDIALERLAPPVGRRWPKQTPAVGSAGFSSRAGRLSRLARVGLHLARGIAIAALVFPFVRPEGRRAHIRDWSRALLDILKVRLSIKGMCSERFSAPLMLVANHVSWLDIYAINAVLPARFVAKSEIREWPLMGWFSEKAGTVFIRRARRRDTVHVVEQLTRVMLGGEPVAVFPEGTTTDGATVLKFHSSLLQPAVLARAVLHPIAIRYVRGDGTRCLEAAYIGGHTLWDSLKQVAGQPEIRVELVFLPALESDGRQRRELACAARSLILRSLPPSAPGIPAGPTGDPPAAAH